MTSSGLTEEVIYSIWRRQTLPVGPVDCHKRQGSGERKWG